MPEIQIRPAVPEDAAAMASVYVAAARGAWRHIFGENDLRTLEPPVERLLARVRDVALGEDVLVADVRGTIRGFVVVRPSADEGANPVRDGELDMIYVDPDSWSDGIGRALLAAAVAALAVRGFTQATLWTAEANRRPRRIYEAAGWEPDGKSRERSWLGVRFRELRYRVAVEPITGQV